MLAAYSAVSAQAEQGADFGRVPQFLLLVRFRQLTLATCFRAEDSV